MSLVEDAEDTTNTFESLGVASQLQEALKALGFKRPTKIQSEAIPIALQGKDIIGLAQTGSGKTAAYAIPILQALLKKPQGLFACVVAPTRYLSVQQSRAWCNLVKGVGIPNFRTV